MVTRHTAAPVVAPSALRVVGLGAALTVAGALCSPLPARAQVVAFAQSGDGARVILHDRSGPCVGDAKLAEHIAPDGRRVAGCWLMSSDKVLISFLDGERGDIPVSHLKRLAEI